MTSSSEPRRSRASKGTPANQRWRYPGMNSDEELARRKKEKEARKKVQSDARRAKQRHERMTSLMTKVVHIVKNNSGIELQSLVARCWASDREVRDALQILVAAGELTMGAGSQIFHRRPIKMVQPSDDRIAAQISKNRSVWIDSVERAWRQLGVNAAGWIANQASLRKRIDVEILGASEHYLNDPKVESTTKVKAQQVLAVVDAIRAWSTTGSIDARAFSPFKWPRTQIRLLAAALNPHSIETTGEILANAGYRVGNSGLSEFERRERLRWLYGDKTVPDLEELPPNSCGRLRRIAYAIAYLVRQAKHRSNADMSAAISDWEADLIWLKVNFYVGKCDRGHFDCPK
jgi:hypothetical protein